MKYASNYYQKLTNRKKYLSCFGKKNPIYAVRYSRIRIQKWNDLQTAMMKLPDLYSTQRCVGINETWSDRVSLWGIALIAAVSRYG